jgi:hypothetical protein
MLESTKTCNVGVDSSSKVIPKGIHSAGQETKMKGNPRDTRPFQAILSGSRYRQSSIQKACPEVEVSLEAFWKAL